MDESASRRHFLTTGLFQTVSSKVKLAHRDLGKTGVKLTALSFGCMTTSDASVIEHAADVGIVHFDTARAYQNGNNERMVGAALKSRRSKVVISSKSAAKTDRDALADLDTSLRELGTDYLDIWYLHMKNEPAEVTDDLLEAQRTAKKAGKIRFAGVSTHFNMDRVLRHLAKQGQTDVALTTYNFAMRSVASDMNTNTTAPKTDMTAAIQEARKSGMGIVVMKTLAGGTTRVQRGDRLYGATPQTLVKRLGQPGAPLAAIKWALRNESVDTAIVCMTDHEQLEENLRAMSEPYTEHDESLLSEQLARIGPIYCRMCGTRSGVCDRGVPVPDMLRFLCYAEGYGQFAMARDHFLVAGRCPLGPLRRLRFVFGELPEWRSGARTRRPGSGFVRVGRARATGRPDSIVWQRFSGQSGPDQRRGVCVVGLDRRSERHSAPPARRSFGVDPR